MDRFYVYETLIFLLEEPSFRVLKDSFLGGGLKHFLLSSVFQEMIQFD